MKLDVVLKLLNLKLKHGWSDKSFTSLLELLHDLFPEDNGLPISTYQAKKLMCPMGLEVERIHACPNNCMLFRKEFENKHNCVSCGASRYKRKKDSDEVGDDVTKNGPPAKMLWYLPIIPRLKRLFSNENEAKLLCWHSEECVIDGKLRHVADSPQWRNIDNKYPEFGHEMRNIRFGLSSDGINPFGNRSSRYSTWPVLLYIYNLPPWLYMKWKYIMMSLLIQGPTQPGNDIDVYMSPLIDDLKTLWSSGVDVYDAYKKEQFQLRAMIFCTISDFPAYGNLLGYKTKGKKACSVCEDMTSSIWLKNCKKTVYMGHRRFLPKGHRYRKNTIEFDGTVEIRTMRTRFDAFSRVENVNVVLGKRFRIDKDALWKKRSIFFELPYWRHLDVRHCLDVMHIEKNVCESLIGLILDIKYKTKDSENVRKDMVEMGIRKDLAPEKRPNNITFLPPASNIKRFVSMKDYKLIGMKSHDCHVLMTHMIPIAIRGILDDDIRHTVTKLCLFFNNIHSKVIDVEDLEQWQKDIYVTLCELEMHYPPSFFDIMVHLISHIVQEIKACGPVFLRYMYPFERYMGILKGYVRNRNRPEGSIDEGYTSEEVVELCQGYMEGVESVGVPKTRHSGRLEGKGGVGSKIIMPTREELQVAHLVVLKHMTCLTPYIDEHMDMLKSRYPGKEESWYINNHYKELSRWLREKVTTTNVDETVKKLGQVQVDKIIESYGDLPVHAVTKTDEVETVKDIYHAVVQWPRYALKLANKETPSKSIRMDSSQSSPQRDTATNKETPNKSTRIDSSHSSPQRDTTTNKETPSKSTRMDSSHSSPQKDSATTSFYYPPFVDNQIPIHPFDGSYTNMLLSLTPRQIATNPTEPKFIDPDVEASLSILRKKGPKYNKILDLLSGLYGDDFSISTYSPQGLYPVWVQFAVPYSEILQPLLNDLLDVSIIRWFAIHRRNSGEVLQQQIAGDGSKLVAGKLGNTTEIVTAPVPGRIPQQPMLLLLDEAERAKEYRRKLVREVVVAAGNVGKGRRKEKENCRTTFCGYRRAENGKEGAADAASLRQQWRQVQVAGDRS
ncbi:hypothetical protein LXL04_029041 [Taraxacum kok-saghyz]